MYYVNAVYLMETYLIGYLFNWLTSVSYNLLTAMAVNTRSVLMLQGI